MPSARFSQSITSPCGEIFDGGTAAWAAHLLALPTVALQPDLIAAVLDQCRSVNRLRLVAGDVAVERQHGWVFAVFAERVIGIEAQHLAGRQIRGDIDTADAQIDLDEASADRQGPAPLLERPPLPAAFVLVVVRRGSIGTGVNVRPFVPGRQPCALA